MGVPFADPNAFVLLPCRDREFLGVGEVAPLVAVYTSHYEPGSPRAGTEAQSVARSPPCAGPRLLRLS